MEDSDEALARASAGGDAEAFDVLMVRHQRAVYAFTLGFTRNAGVADELTQETFVKAWRSLKGFRGDSGFRTWLFQIALNNVRSWGRREAVRRRLEAPLAWFRRDGETPRDEPADAGPGPGEQAEGRDWAERLAAAVRALPERRRTVFLMRHGAGLPLAEIARVLGLAEGTVKATLFQTLAELRKELKDDMSGS